MEDEKIEELLKGLEKAYETESLAVEAYMKALRDLKELGALSPKTAELFIEITLDSIIHRNIVAALIKALKEAKDLRKQLSTTTSEEEGEPGKEQAEYLRRLLEEHEKIEEGAEQLYKTLAEKAPTKLIATILRAIAEDEEKHDKYLEKLK